MENLNKKIVVKSSFIIGLSLIVSVCIFSWAFYISRNSTNALSVTGSASVDVVSDSAKFSGNFSRIVDINNLKTGYAEMSSDLLSIKSFLKNEGIDDASITIYPVTMSENYSNNMQTETGYTLSQQVEVSSSDINKITQLAQDTQKLINNDVIFSTNPVEYYYTKLPDLRVSLLSDAIKDAQARAKKMAESTGKSVGNIESAASGVVQVLSKGSINEVSDYGTYDTSEINKTVMVTVRASFGLK